MRLTREERKVILKISSFGGRKAARNMTPEQRRDRAIRGAKTRWANQQAKLVQERVEVSQ